ncbi:probable pectinesterase/pectinesterase inhibitor 46 isoform X1 [Pistacia vera]|uniref:probable pectinesterase/pectinesterase inhibitor 46 isoform X1 n=1 Tax=Pistacia vera TaxID=55513 RepID=UPI00126316A8|nr:probable pectinesterase/pectinesterase inhibitor 46 isoform X1 [Pistacia vera]
MSSFRSYGKVDALDQVRLEARRKTRRRIAIISLSSVLLIGIIVAAVVGTRASKDPGEHSKNVYGAIPALIKAACDVTLYKDSCYSNLINATKDSSMTPKDVFKLSMRVAWNELSKASEYFSENGNDYTSVTTGNFSVAAWKNCKELLGLALDHVNDSIYAIDSVDDLKTWLSSAGTYQQTCIDGFEEESEGKKTVTFHLKNSTELISNSLAIISWIAKITKSVQMRRLMNNPEGENKPSWLKSRDHRMLIESSDHLKRAANVVVAKDGTGGYKTISAALKAVPDKSKKRFIIYVKKGNYTENVRVEKPKQNVMIIGDGMNQTIVSGSLNFVDGTPTFSTATFAVFGKGFIARDMGFRNTAGPQKHQAVALMASADQVVFYQCQIDAFQDSLYTHSNRQFYRECDIYGTIDFIFGNSAVVLQNCNILARKPMQGQKNTITAQGKVDPNQNTGISIQNCTISPYGNLTGVNTFLGRPWKNYSTTVFMQSIMGNLIHPKGWLPWTGDSAPDTIFYAEYENFGPGASTKNRVKWKGLRKISAKQAEKFTVKAFLQGKKWISDAGVRYKPGL